MARNRFVVETSPRRSVMLYIPLCQMIDKAEMYCNLRMTMHNTGGKLTMTIAVQDMEKKKLLSLRSILLARKLVRNFLFRYFHPINGTISTWR